MRLAPAALFALALAAPAGAQGPATPASAPQRSGAGAQATAVLTITVTEATGAVLPDVTVTAVGPVTREGITTAAGQVRLLGIRAGTYRLRFEREGFTTFEKEVSWRAGTPAPRTEATLTPAAPPPEPPPAPAAPPVTAAPTYVPDLPAGQPANVSVPDYIERNHITTKDPHKENLIGCSGGAQTWLWQVREPWQGRVHEAAELMLYVVGGEGTISLDGREISAEAGTLFVIPRGTTYGVVKRGRAPAMYLLATLSGPPCPQ